MLNSVSQHQMHVNNSTVGQNLRRAALALVLIELLQVGLAQVGER